MKGYIRSGGINGLFEVRNELVTFGFGWDDFVQH